MDLSWMIALVAVHYLPYQITMVTAQFGVVYDDNTKTNKYQSALSCSTNNFYRRSPLSYKMSSYTDRHDTECCYTVHTRNKCCEKTSYDFARSQFTRICKCDPEVACGSVTPTTPTTPPTTPSPRLFCPSVQKRVLNSLPVSDKCGAYPGVFRIIRRLRTTGSAVSTVCNAVLAQAAVNAIRKTTLVTSQTCKKFADVLQSIPSLEVGVEISPGTIIPYSSINSIEGNTGAAFFDPDTVSLLSLTSLCSKTACGLRNPEMIGKINYDDCHVTSYGSYQYVASTGDLKQGGLRRISVRIYPAGCRDVSITSKAANILCFTSSSQVDVLCSGDAGAPVFCKSSVSDENIVVGMVAGSARCGQETSFGVVPYPAH